MQSLGPSRQATGAAGRFSQPAVCSAYASASSRSSRSAPSSMSSSNSQPSPYGSAFTVSGLLSSRRVDGRDHPRHRAEDVGHALGRLQLAARVARPDGLPHGRQRGEDDVAELVGGVLGDAHPHGTAVAAPDPLVLSGVLQVFGVVRHSSLLRRVWPAGSRAYCSRRGPVLPLARPTTDRRSSAISNGIGSAACPARRKSRTVRRRCKVRAVATASLCSRRLSTARSRRSARPPAPSPRSGVTRSNTWLRSLSACSRSARLRSTSSAAAAASDTSRAVAGSTREANASSAAPCARRTSAVSRAAHVRSARVLARSHPGGQPGQPPAGREQDDDQDCGDRQLDHPVSAETSPYAASRVAR